MRSIRTGSGLVLKCVRKRQGTNWIILPGGPGIYFDYLKRPVLDAIQSGSIWGLDTRILASRVSNGEEFISVLQCDLIKLVEALGDSAIIGHSFGGMLALGTPQLSSRLRAIILMNTSPSREWEKFAERRSLKVSNTNMDKAEANYLKRPNDRALRELFVEWAPYYFSERNVSLGKKYLKNLKYDWRSYKYGAEAFLADYRNRWRKVGIPVLMLSGEKDNVTPLKLFKNVNFPFSYRAVIPKAGHFPWVENSKAFRRALSSFELHVIGGV